MPKQVSLAFNPQGLVVPVANILAAEAAEGFDQKYAKI